MKSKSYLFSFLRCKIWEPFTNSIIIALKDIKHALGQSALGGQLSIFISCETTLWKLRLFSCFLMPWLAPLRHKPRIWAQFCSKAVLWTFDFGPNAKKSSDIVDSELISIDRSLNEPMSFFLRLILLLDQTYQIRVLPISCLTGLCRLMGIYVWDENLAAVLTVATFTPPVSGSGDVVH